ncbi:response regulator [Alphaproteobacteria bacterium HT1-32]|jgi:FixJ family two-component response regulator|nr:response regulator [Alphaproteobacteria bacterium HT1-32]
MTNDEALVYIVDDIEANRDLLLSLLKKNGIATEAYGTADQFLDEMAADRPGCILLDIRMPGMDGLTALRELQSRECPLPVIMVTAHGDVPVAIEAMKSGAFDFVEKPINTRQVLASVEQAIGISHRNILDRQELLKAREGLESLSQRERDVLNLIAGGLMNKQIAFELSISQRTVEVHRSRVMEKMGAITVADLVRSSLLVGIGKEDS